MRTAVPCKGRGDYYGHRCGHAATLGEVFLSLGKWLPAATVYQYYSTLRIVALLKPKDATKPGAKGITGVSGGPLQATNIANEILDSEVWVPLKNKRVLIKVGLDPADGYSEGFRTH